MAGDQGGESAETQEEATGGDAGRPEAVERSWLYIDLGSLLCVMSVVGYFLSGVFQAAC